MSFQNQVVIVTGGSKGIGAAGARVTVLDLDAGGRGPHRRGGDAVRS